MAGQSWTSRTAAVALAFLFLNAMPPSLLAQRTTLRPLAQQPKGVRDFVIDPKTPLKDLLPPPPNAVTPRTLLVRNLVEVPEVQFQENAIVLMAANAIAHQMAKINFLNGQKTDRFVELLLENRPDLAGLPFTL